LLFRKLMRLGHVGREVLQGYGGSSCLGRHGFVSFDQTV
jgi:hypothetical protein